jgi:hypothetical protein
MTERVPTARLERAEPSVRPVEFADTFQRALGQLEQEDPVAGERCRRRISDFQMNRVRPGWGWERLSNPDLWSLRVTDDIRIIFRGPGVFTFLYVGRHADAYRWAGRQRRL